MPNGIAAPLAIGLFVGIVWAIKTKPWEKWKK